MEISKHKEKYNAYIKSQDWYSLKIDLIQKRGCQCERCGRKKPIQILQIHHITYERLFNELAADLLILCPICHMKEHGLIKVKVKYEKQVSKKPGKRYKPKRINKKISKRLHAERVANEKFTAAKRRRVKGKSLAAWQQ